MPNAGIPDLPEDRARTDLSIRSADEEGTAIGSEPVPGVFDRVDVFFRDLGPGLITGCADDDPSGISTYSIAGAGFGYGMLWTALLSFPLMVSVQMMCSRLGMVTGRGLASVIRMHYPRWVLWGACLLLVTTNVINIAADLGGMGESAAMVTGVSAKVWTLLFTALNALVLHSDRNGRKETAVPYDEVMTAFKGICDHHQLIKQQAAQA